MIWKTVFYVVSSRFYDLYMMSSVIYWVKKFFFREIPENHQILSESFVGHGSHKGWRSTVKFLGAHELKKGEMLKKERIFIPQTKPQRRNISDSCVYECGRWSQRKNESRERCTLRLYYILYEKSALMVFPSQKVVFIFLWWWSLLVSCSSLSNRNFKPSTAASSELGRVS